MAILSQYSSRLSLRSGRDPASSRRMASTHIRLGFDSPDDLFSAHGKARLNDQAAK